VAELPPLPDIFGNYTIRGINEVLAPEAIGWLPSAPGWRYAGVLLLLLAGWRTWLYWQKWRRNRYRRAALQELDRLIDSGSRNGGLLQALSALLKATALQAYPRVEVARLSGDNWLRWLNERSDNACFSSNSATLLTESVYQAPGETPAADIQQLLSEARNWIRLHREANSA
jgi:hypothetical protein